MNKNQKVLLVFIGFCMCIVVGLIAFNVLMPKPEVQPEKNDVTAKETESSENTDINTIQEQTNEKTEEKK